MQWPLRWLYPMEVARDTYEAITAVNDALATKHGDELEAWQQKHTWEMNKAMAALAIRDELNDA